MIRSTDMFGKNDFDFIPDMDFDGDHDLMDALILGAVMTELDSESEDSNDDSSDEW